MTHMGQRDKAKLGEILCQKNFLSEQQLDEVLQEQRLNKAKRFGDFLVETHVCSRAQIEETVQHLSAKSTSSRGQRLGEMLTSAGILSREELKGSLIAFDKVKSRKLGSILIQKNLLDEEQLIIALAEHLDTPIVNLETKEPYPLLSQVVDENLSLEMGIVPIDLRGKNLVVATTEPDDPITKKYLKFKTGHNVKMVLASGSKINSFHKKLYQNEPFPGQEELQKSTPNLEAQKQVFRDKNPFGKTFSPRWTLKKLFLKAIKDQVAFIHFESGPHSLRVRFRKEGHCVVEFEFLAQHKHLIMSELKKLAHLNQMETKKRQTGQIVLNGKSARFQFRIETNPVHLDEEDAVLQINKTTPPLSLAQLGFSQKTEKKIQALVQKNKGLVLCVGPVGSGKTTLLHAAIRAFCPPNKKIWTIEDPIEITQPGARQVQVDHEKGVFFQNTLESFLRSDPDILLVGDILDLGTLKLVIRAAQTGYLVFSALNAPNAAEGLNRLLEVEDEDPSRVVQALSGIVSQRLVLKLCDYCKESFNPEASLYEQMIGAYGVEMAQVDNLPEYSKDLVLMRKKGCPRCHQTGYLGQTALQEIIINSNSFIHMIEARRSGPNLNSVPVYDGMRPLIMDGIRKIFDGLTDFDQVKKACP